MAAPDDEHKSGSSADELFARERPALVGLAYRMLGSRSEAEDAVQDTFLKWEEAERSGTRAAIQNSAAWLTTTCTRRCIDLLRSAQRLRVEYVGAWLPEAVHTPPHLDDEHAMNLASSLSTAFLLMLERLSPRERAAYLLHDIFERPYGRIAEIGRLFGGGMYFGAGATDDVLRLYSAWVETVPEQMGSSVLLIAMPDIPAVPAPMRGRHVTHVRFAWSGPVEAGERWVRPFREIAPPLIDTTRDMPYRDVGSIHNEPTAPVPFLARNSMLRALDEAAIEPLLALAGPDAAAPFLVELRHFGGALSRAPQIPNAVGRRDGAFCVYTGSVVAPGREDECRAAQAALHDSLQPWSTGGVCLNFLTGPEITPEILRSGYLPADFDRLVELKRRYDPENVFRINHNIDPTINET